MACFSPLLAWQLDSGEIVFREKGRVKRHLSLACGQCVGCRLDRSREWALRCVHEAQLHADNCFVTLTYSPENLPVSGSLVYRDFQLFMKRLRKLRGPVRFYMCGEYGEKHWRPHYHACLFGVAFADRASFGTSPSGSRIYRSPELESLWTLGHSSLGDVTFESAAYIARYIMKKRYGDAAKAHYTRLDPSTGELVSLHPEFTRMSLKPGIGAGWITKFKSDVFPRDRIVARGGMEMPVPKYYDRVLSEDEVEDVMMLREQRAARFSDDNSPARLRVRETVAKAALSFKKRSLE